MADPRSICVIRLSAIGDAINTLPLLNGLRRGFPFSRLTWVVQPVPHQLVQHQSAVDEFIVFDPRRGISAWRELRQTLATRQFDLVIVPQISAKAWLVARLFGPVRRLGFDFRRSRELHWFMTSDHLPPRERQHVLDEQLEFLEALGVAREPVVWDLVVTAEEKEAARRFYAQFQRPAVALVVATSKEEKNWTPRGYARVIEALDRDFGMQPLLIGGASPKERSIVDTILSESEVEPAVALDAPLRSTLWKLWGADLVISPDTGPLHAAVALDKPVIGLYGYTDPRRCGPYRRSADLLIDKFGEAGKITRNTRPGRMQAITPEDVLHKVAIAQERYLDGTDVARSARNRE